MKKDQISIQKRVIVLWDYIRAHFSTHYNVGTMYPPTIRYDYMAYDASTDYIIPAKLNSKFYVSKNSGYPYCEIIGNELIAYPLVLKGHINHMARGTPTKGFVRAYLDFILIHELCHHAHNVHVYGIIKQAMFDGLIGLDAAMESFLQYTNMLGTKEDECGCNTTALQIMSRMNKINTQLEPIPGGNFTRYMEQFHKNYTDRLYAYLIAKKEHEFAFLTTSTEKQEQLSREIMQLLDEVAKRGLIKPYLYEITE